MSRLFCTPQYTAYYWNIESLDAKGHFALSGLSLPKGPFVGIESHGGTTEMLFGATMHEGGDAWTLPGAAMTVSGPSAMSKEDMLRTVAAYDGAWTALQGLIIGMHMGNRYSVPTAGGASVINMASSAAWVSSTYGR